MVLLKFDDEARATELAETFRRIVAELPMLTIDTAEERLRDVARAQKRKLADEYLGSTWGVSFKEYLDGALNNLPEEEKRTTAEAVKNLNLNAGLVVGMFVDGLPSVLTIDQDGSVYGHNEFAVRGSGQHIAYASLYQREYDSTLPLNQAMYLVYEAKRLSESDPHVGAKQDILVLTRDAPIRECNDQDMVLLESQYQDFGLQRLTADMAPLYRHALWQKDAEIAELKAQLETHLANRQKQASRKTQKN